MVDEKEKQEIMEATNLLHDYNIAQIRISQTKKQLSQNEKYVKKKIYVMHNDFRFFIVYKHNYSCRAGTIPICICMSLWVNNHFCVTMCVYRKRPSTLSMFFETCLLKIIGEILLLTLNFIWKKK